ncbi:hypothetical protein C0J50_1740, partial [Silurus asotus]
LKILIVYGTKGDEPLAVFILLKGTFHYGYSKNAKACTLLMGLIYALKLAYPRALRCTFEVFQE